MLKKRHSPITNTPAGKKDGAVKNVLEGLKVISPEDTGTPSSTKHGTFASTIDTTLFKKEPAKEHGEKDQAVHNILESTKKPKD